MLSLWLRPALLTCLGSSCPLTRTSSMLRSGMRFSSQLCSRVLLLGECQLHGE